MVVKQDRIRIEIPLSRRCRAQGRTSIRCRSEARVACCTGIGSAQRRTRGLVIRCCRGVAGDQQGWEIRTGYATPCEWGREGRLAGAENTSPPPSPTNVKGWSRIVRQTPNCCNGTIPLSGWWSIKPLQCVHSAHEIRHLDSCATSTASRAAWGAIRQAWTGGDLVQWGQGRCTA
jgi:hypothetical protein